MEGYRFDETLKEEDRVRAVAAFFAPGERVRIAEHMIAKADRGLVEAAVSGLTVERVEVGADRVLYGFRECEGLHGFALFVDAREEIHVYGALVEVDGRAWVVEMDADGQSDVPTGRAVALEGVTGRYVAWNNGIDSDETLLAEATEGMSGEFVAVLDDDGWKLVAIPWASGLDPLEREAAEAAVRAQDHAEVPSAVLSAATLH